MLNIQMELFKRELRKNEVAERAGIAPETLSRLAAGKQKPSYAPGGSAERIARAIGYEGDVHELFAEVGDE